MHILRNFLIAAAFGAVWVSIALFQGHSLQNWPPLVGGFLLFVIVGPALALVVRLVATWWKGRL